MILKKKLEKFKNYSNKLADIGSQSAIERPVKPVCGSRNWEIHCNPHENVS